MSDTELGYSIGDRVIQGAAASSNAGGDGYMVEYDATNVRVLTGQNAVVLIQNRSTPELYSAGTLANWRIVAQPYL